MFLFNLVVGYFLFVVVVVIVAVVEGRGVGLRDGRCSEETDVDLQSKTGI